MHGRSTFGRLSIGRRSYKGKSKKLPRRRGRKKPSTRPNNGANCLRKKSSRLNYLVSTKAQPGVFNGPYHEQPTVDGVPLETCIKQNVNAYLKKNKLDRKKSVLKPYPPRNKMSIQMTSKYDVPRKAQQRARQQNKRRWIGPKNMLTGRRPHTPVYRRGFQEGCEYIEPRELKKTSKERLEKDKKRRVSQKPFQLTSRTGHVLDR